MPLRRDPWPTPAPHERDPSRQVPAPGGRSPRRRPPPLRVVLWRARLPFAAVLVGCACAVVVGQLRPPPATTTPVVVAARTLAAGHVLTRGDLRVVAVPPRLVPHGAPAQPDVVVGTALAVTVGAGLPLTAELLHDEPGAAPDGTVTAPVRFADDAVAALMSPGLFVDVLAASEDGSPGRYLARRALVLPSLGGACTPADSSLLGPAPGLTSGPPVLLAVSPEEAAALAGAGPAALLSAVLVP